MNANELADEIDGAVLKLVADNHFTEAQAVEESQTMLRQQQSEIAKLKAEIEALKSGGEPVAFMNAHGSCLSVKALNSVDGVLGFDRPLYDRPAKTQDLALPSKEEIEGYKVPNHACLYSLVLDALSESATPHTKALAIAKVHEFINRPAKTLTEEEKFKDAYMANFLSAYMAVRYDNDCANGHPLKGYQPIEDAQFLANEAWAILRKAQEK